MAPAHPLPANPFKQRLAAGTAQFGLWLALDSPTATEILAGAGYEWLLLDLEHTCTELASVIAHLRAAQGGTAELVVRVPQHDPAIFKRLLDAGVRSFMVPMVQNAVEARSVVAATRYPPQGIRGVAGNSRASAYNRIPSYFARAHEQVCLIAQIESPSAVDAIEQIGAVEGIDALFIGPNDLAAGMGFIGEAARPEVVAAIGMALDRIRRTGKAPGILNFVPAEARQLLQRGFSFIAVGGDAAFLARRSEALLTELKAAP
jgi:4-hydroxy-2-oxoheptanedioate aldolase